MSRFFRKFNFRRLAAGYDIRQKYECSSGRQGCRSGHYKRNFQTTAGEVELNVPKLKGVPFETAIIECYRRRESSVEEALIEMYLAGVSLRRVQEVVKLDLVERELAAPTVIEQSTPALFGVPCVVTVWKY